MGKAPLTPPFMIKIFALLNSSYRIIAPPCASPAPVGAGAHVMPPYYLQETLW